MICTKKFTAALACGLLFALVGNARAAAKYEVVKTIPIGGEGRWDYITVDPATKIVYVGRSTY